MAAIEGAGGEQMRNQKALVDQMQKVRTLHMSPPQASCCTRAPTPAAMTVPTSSSEATQQQQGCL